MPLNLNDGIRRQIVHWFYEFRGGLLLAFDVTRPVELGILMACPLRIEYRGMLSCDDTRPFLRGYCQRDGRAERGGLKRRSIRAKSGPLFGSQMRRGLTSKC